MLNKTKVAGAVLAVIGGTMVAGVPTASAQSQRVEVTGSNIKRLDAETVSPVEIINREDIERTGQPTVADLLRSSVFNTGGGFGEGFGGGNSFAPGASAASLRGLGAKTTLVLINGRRTAGYGFAQNLNASFVDLNQIPASAVDRIEVVRDGASAIYGSDAIAGVVNIIMRKDYNGMELSASGGASEGKTDRRATATLGRTGLAGGKASVFGTLDYYQRDLLLQGDTQLVKSRDFRGRYEGGRNLQSLTAGGTWQQVSAAGGALITPTSFRAISECSGTVMTGPQAVEAGLINLTPTTQSAAALAQNQARAAATNTFCTYDFKDQFTILPGTKRLNGFFRATFDVSASTTAYAEVGLSRTESEQKFQAPFFAGTTGLQQTAAGLRPFPFNTFYNPGVAGNPFDTRAVYNGVLNDMGTRDSLITSDVGRLVAGMLYTFKDWDFDSAFGVARTNTETINTTRLTLNGVASVIGITSAPQPPTPTSSASLYNYDKPSTNTDAIRDRMRVNFPRRAESTLSFIDTKASTIIGQGPGGPIGLAVGGEYRRETLADIPADIAQQGQILGQGITKTDGSRSNFSTFAELSIPAGKLAEMQLALRHDRYSDYGNSTTPKVGVKVRAADGLLIRANAGTGFRAPTLPEISPSVATFFTSVTDPQDGASRQISGVYGGNAQLQPETSQSRVVGAVWEPSRMTSVGANYYSIVYSNVVASPSFQSLINASCPVRPSPTNPAPCPSTPSVIRDPLNNQVVTIISGYVNLNSRVTSGYDFDLRHRMRTDWGLLAFSFDGTLVKMFKENGVDALATNSASSTIPRFRSGTSLTATKDALSGTFRVNYTSRYTQGFLNGTTYSSVQDPRFQTGVLPSNVRSHTTLDFFGRYQVNKRTTASFSLINVTNRLPPFDPAWGTFADSQLYDMRGRQVRASLSYRM
jgi:iron complex outermembrane receptor protein